MLVTCPVNLTFLNLIILIIHLFLNSVLLWNYFGIFRCNISWWFLTNRSTNLSNNCLVFEAEDFKPATVKTYSKPSSNSILFTLMKIVFAKTVWKLWNWENMAVSRTNYSEEYRTVTEECRHPLRGQQMTTADVVCPLVRPKPMEESRLSLVLGINIEHCRVKFILIRIGPVNLYMRFKLKFIIFSWMVQIIMAQNTLMQDINYWNLQTFIWSIFLYV
jgi:hypothetical protein